MTNCSSYEILCENNLVAKWEDNELTVYNEALLPLFLKRVSNADLWLRTRAVDSSRANSRLLKKALHLKEKDDLSIVIHANGATITDRYWVRPIGSNTQYSDISFTYDFLSKRVSNIALKGDYTSFTYVATHKSNSPYKLELTNTGSFEKCWRLVNNKWWLYKKATHEECFSELFVFHLCQALNINAAEYKKVDSKTICSLDFTDCGNVTFEPALSFMGENEDYFDVIEKLKSLYPNAIPDYIKMIFIDTIVANPDRHTGNFGLLRSKNSGEIIGFAPLFDHNLALISRGYPNKTAKNDLLVKLFNDVIEKYPDYKCYIPSLSEDMIMNIINDIGMRVRKNDIADIIMNRYKLINK